jgi:hypothetical protein
MSAWKREMKRQERWEAQQPPYAMMVVEQPDIYKEYEEFNFYQSHQYVNSNWILLDTCSITDIFCNARLLMDIWYMNTTLKIHCNTVTNVIKQVVTLNNYGTVWYCEDVISNILSLSQLKKQFPVHYDSP